MICILGAIWSNPAQAQGIRLLRDADIEHGLRELAKPVLQAAGLNPQRMRILVVDSPSFNAFVIDRSAIFLNYGLILKVTKPEMLQAVIAHEAAHITNGHIGRRTQNARSANSAAGLGLALSALAAALGGGEAAAGIAAGTRTAALRGFLAHTRAEEASADRTAIGVLRRAGINPRGMVELHGIFAGQENLSRRSQDPYMRSHPLTRDRVRAAEAFASAHPADVPTPESATYWLARVQTKISAFKRAPQWNLRKVASAPTEDIAQMRAAVAHHRQHNFARAEKALLRLLSLAPRDAFYHDLAGQIYAENRRWSDARAAFAQAAQLAPRDPLILAGLGRAQLNAGQTKAAVATLERARTLDFRNSRLLRDMSLAYAQLGQNGLASVVTAERYALQGRLKDAAPHATRAMRLLPTGSPPWRRAQDVAIAFEHAQKRN